MFELLFKRFALPHKKKEKLFDTDHPVILNRDCFTVEINQLTESPNKPPGRDTCVNNKDAG